MSATLSYGPMIECPIATCRGIGFTDDMAGELHPLGSVVEHLYEQHKRSIVWIDEWLGRVADG